MPEKSKEVICDFVDHVMPNLTAYESSLYMLLLRLSFFADDSLQVRVGKTRISQQLGKSTTRAVSAISGHQVNIVIRGLEEKGCINIGDTTREGTLYTLLAPREIPFVKEKLATPVADDEDYFSDSEKRRSIFERDKWSCQYCGETVNGDNATLDHYIPQSKGGTHSRENLRTCCLLCNSIKSGKSFEEAAPLLLKSIQERKQRRRE